MSFTSSTIRILSLLLGLWAATVTVTAFGSVGVVKPSDPYRFEGDSLRLFCNITDESIQEDSSMLYFDRKRNRDSEDVTIPRKYIRTLTTKSIRLDLPLLDIRDEGVYTCFQKTYEDGQRLIGAQYLTVDHSPKKVDHIDCRVFNWERMRCNWTLGLSYNHPENINVTLIWTKEVPKSSPSYKVQQSCPKMVNKTVCEWPVSSYSHGHVYLMVIKVAFEADGKVWKKAISSVFRKDTNLLVEPGPITELQAIEENSSCISLSWNHLKKLEKKFFVGQFKKLDSSDWTNIEMDYLAMEEMKVRVCDLDPFTRYIFRIAVLPEDPSQMSIPLYQSEWTSISARTREDVPGVSPALCPSCYHIQDCNEGRRGCRMVRIYWQKVPQAKRHGEITGYSIRLKKGSSSVSFFNETAEATSKMFQITDASYNLQLRAANSKGFSATPSVLRIASQDERPQPPQKFLVETYSTDGSTIKYFLSWAVLSNRFNYSKIVVVWCQGKTLSQQGCEGPINQAYLRSNEVTFELKTKRTMEVMIGVAAEVFDGKSIISSGIEWSSCIYLRNKKPKNGPMNLRSIATQKNNGLSISWEKFSCLPDRVFVTDYRVTLCRTPDNKTCDAPEQNKTTHSTQVTFEKLDPDKKYLIKVWAISSAGDGPKSEHVARTAEDPFPEDNGSPNVAPFAVIGGLSLIFLLVVFCLCIKHCNHRRKKVPKPDELIQPYAETKRPLNQPAPFRNRPLPEPPSAELLYYGLNACMTTPGSSTSSRSSSENSENFGQVQPLLNQGEGIAGNQKKSSKKKKNNHHQISKKEGDLPLSQSKSSSFHKADNVRINTDGYSLENSSSGVHEYFQVNNKNDNADQKIPNFSSQTDTLQSRNAYETPIIPPELSDIDAAQWKLHEQKTLPKRRKFPPKVPITIGENLKAFQHSSPPHPPSTIPPPLPMRQPMPDAPPPYSAPPPPQVLQPRQNLGAVSHSSNGYLPNGDIALKRLSENSSPHDAYCQCDSYNRASENPSPIESYCQCDSTNMLTSSCEEPPPMENGDNNEAGAYRQVCPPFPISFPPPPSFPPSPNPVTQTLKSYPPNLEQTHRPNQRHYPQTQLASTPYKHHEAILPVLNNEANHFHPNYHDNSLVIETPIPHPISHPTNTIHLSSPSTTEHMSTSIPTSFRPISPPMGGNGYVSYPDYSLGSQWSNSQGDSGAYTQCVDIIPT